jgi:hypothetical protein
MHGRSLLVARVVDEVRSRTPQMSPSDAVRAATALLPGELGLMSPRDLDSLVRAIAARVRLDGNILSPKTGMAQVVDRLVGLAAQPERLRIDAFEAARTELAGPDGAGLTADQLVVASALGSAEAIAIAPMDVARTLMRVMRTLPGFDAGAPPARSPRQGRTGNLMYHVSVAGASVAILFTGNVFTGIELRFASRPASRSRKPSDSGHYVLPPELAAPVLDLRGLLFRRPTPKPR